MSNETCSFLLDNPSISPKNYTEGITPTNPALRLFSYATSNDKSLLQYEQYYFNLKDFNATIANITVENWEREYSTLEHWNISALTPLQLTAYFDKLNGSAGTESATDEMYMYLVRASVSFDKEPLQKCQSKTFCKLRQMVSSS